MDSLDLWFWIVLTVTAFLYASVGHGGASGYLALLALYGFAPAEAKVLSLALNVGVAALAWINFYRKETFQWSMLGWFLIGSIPMAYWGSTFTLQPYWYKMAIGIVLLFPIIRLWQSVYNTESSHNIQVFKIIWVVPIGAAIGFFSGLIGIGGGILLSPLLLWLHWSTPKQTAALSAAFIWVNSCVGLISGQHTAGSSIELHWPILAVAFIMGLLGAYVGAQYYPSIWLKRVLAVVLLLASIKLTNVLALFS